MRKSHIAISAAVSAVALAVLSPGLASAADTNATFTITGGELAISAPESQELTIDGTAGALQVAGGNITDITVTDARQTTGGWVATAISTDFASAADNVTADNVDYSAFGLEPTGTVTAEAGAGQLDAAVPVVTATGVSGANTVTWSGAVTVTLPADVLAGAYTGTITHSVA